METLSHIYIGIILLSEIYDFLFVSGSSDTAGHSSLVGQNLLDVLHPSHVPKLRETLTKVVNERDLVGKTLTYPLLCFCRPDSDFRRRAMISAVAFGGNGEEAYYPYDISVNWFLSSSSGGGILLSAFHPLATASSAHADKLPIGLSCALTMDDINVVGR